MLHIKCHFLISAPVPISAFFLKAPSLELARVKNAPGAELNHYGVVMYYFLETKFKFGASIIPIDSLPTKKTLHHSLKVSFTWAFEAFTTYKKLLMVALQSVIYG